MKNISKILLLIIAVASLFSCKGYSQSEGPDQTEILEKAISTAGTEIAKTQEAVLSPTSTYSPTIWATATQWPGENIVVPPKPGEQVYTDPEGWYSVNFPSEFELTNQENLFSMSDRFIETGYLPEMGNISSPNNVCAWLANIVEKEPENWLVNRSFSSESCSIITRPEISRQIKYEVFYNPGADPDHRFIYLKTGWYDCPFHTTFSWLKPTNQQYVQKLAPINSELITEWETIAPLMQNVTVTEYDLPPGSSPHREMLISSLPEEAKPAWARDTYTPSDQNASEEPPTENILESLGYEMKYPDGGNGYGQLFRDGRLLFDPVWKTAAYKYLSDTGPITTIVVISDYWHDESYLIQNDVIHQWISSHQDPPFPPILYQDELLWIRASEDWDHVEVIKSNQEVIFSFSIHTEPIYSTKNFIKWDGHWVWVLRDFVIIDGEILNEKLGFQEIFYWRLVDGKPAYFFRKDGLVGFSYNGKIFPLEYQDIARYKCCGYTVNNPSIGDHNARFFAERDGVWFYVVLKYR